MDIPSGKSFPFSIIYLINGEEFKVFRHIHLGKVSPSEVKYSKAKNGEKKREKERKRERKRERLNDGDNNGQATHGARKHAWRTQAAWANLSNSEVWY